jgi:predicted RNA polymerase sigma factor
VLASLVGFLGDFDRAEEAAQEAFAIAAERWPAAGVPANPRAWLVATARNKAIDRIRRERTLAEKIHLLPVPEAVMDELDDTAIKDERLELIFTCCHPALALDGQVALTLQRTGRPGRRSHPAWPDPSRADAGRAGGVRAARADDDPPRPAAGPVLRR